MFVYCSHKCLATCAIAIIYPTLLVLSYYFGEHICICASVYSNFNIICTQLYIKYVLQYDNVVSCELKILGGRIMSRIF